MGSAIDSVGVFIGEVLESGLTLTSKNNYPQWVARFKATQKWIEEPSEMAHFKLTEPGYVDWSSFNEEIVAYMVLFKSAEEFSKDTQMLNYEQVQLALAWDGTEFDSLADGTQVGKSLQFRVETNEYEGKTRLQVNWVDAADAPAQRQLRVIDAAAVKGLSAKLKIVKTVKPAAAAKPAVATKPGKPAAAPVAKSPVTTAPVAAETSGTTPADAPAKPATTAKKPAAKAATPAGSTASTPASAPPKKAATPPPSSKLVAPVQGLPAETDQGTAWTIVCVNKGDNTDDVVQEAWIAGCREVGEDRDEDDFTAADWAKVRDIVIRDLNLTVTVTSVAEAA